MKKKVIVAITGASGTMYAVQTIALLKTLGVDIHGIISSAGKQVARLELGKRHREIDPDITWFDETDFAAPMSSGSSRYEGMVVVPCSMGTLGAIAGGQSRNLIHRAADVALKERRRLILAVRETPFNRIHLENMLKLHDAGAVICPAMPAFYHRPADIEALTIDYACRIVTLLGFEVPDMKRWSGMPGVGEGGADDPTAEN